MTRLSHNVPDCPYEQRLANLETKFAEREARDEERWAAMTARAESQSATSARVEGKIDTCLTYIARTSERSATTKKVVQWVAWGITTVIALLAWGHDHIGPVIAALAPHAK